ncbi:MAG: SURF1 family protein, partial [Pseudomonadota bacterium]
MRRSDVLWAVPALLACAGFAWLGAWQLQRGAWKERLLAGWASAASEAPRDYAAVLAGRSALPRREDLAAPTADPALPLAVVVHGRWDPATTLLLDNQRLDAAIGVFVLTRFVPAAGATPLLVNRGWLPLPPDRTPPTVPSPGPGETT